MNFRRLFVPLILLWIVLGCDESSPNDSGEESDDTNGGEDEGCPNADGDNPHGISPDSPDDPEIVQACIGWCDQATASSCGTAAECVEECRWRACNVCPGKLAPFIGCLSENYSVDECTCDASGPDCDPTEACQDLRFELGACGG